MPKGSLSHTAHSGKGGSRQVCHVRPVFISSPAIEVPAETSKDAADQRFLLHLIKSCLGRDRKRLRHSVQLKCDYLRPFFSKDRLKRNRDALVDAGILRCDYHAIEGVKAFSYGLTGKGLSRVWECQKICEPAFTRRYWRVMDQLQDLHAGQLSETQAKIVACTRRLSIDEDAAEQLITSRVDPNNHRVTLRRLNERDGWHRLGITNRLYLPTTNLWKPLLPLVRGDGDPLDTMDMSNSQHVMISWWLWALKRKPNFAKKVFDRVNRLGNRSTKENPISFLDIQEPQESVLLDEEGDLLVDTRGGVLAEYASREGGSSSPWLTTPKKQPLRGVGIGPDYLSRYHELTTSGTLYETIAERLGVPRSEVSQPAVAFLGRKGKTISPVEREFKRMFPPIHRYFRQVNSKGHANLPCFLQRLESLFVFELVAKEVFRRWPDILLITKHDSLSSNRIEAVEEVWPWAEKQFGCKIPWKIED